MTPLYDNPVDIKQAHTFDDLFIVPSYSEVESRNDVDVSTQFTRNFKIHIPLVAAPMDSVCEQRMAERLFWLGGIGCLHRFTGIYSQAEMVKATRNSFYHEAVGEADPTKPLCAAIGANGDFEDRADALVEAGANILLIDVAHGHHINVKRALSLLNNKSWRSRVDIIAGNIATLDAAHDLESWGADALRVGIGGGSMCTTRIMTGVGVPQLQTIIDIAPNVNIPVISDGGIRSPGDVAKCLAAGASSVMIGNMFAGTDETPGETIGIYPHLQKVYRGSASFSAKSANGQKTNHVEGVSTCVDAKGPVGNVVAKIMDGVRSSMSYVGANNLQEFHQNAKFVQVSHAGLTEAHPHGVR
jgi:IMP dehydrogenase